MSGEIKKEISNAQMQVIITDNPKYKIKSMLTIIVLLLIFIGIIFFMGTVVPEFFVFIIFILILSLPVIILLRQNLYGIIPSFIKTSLLEIDKVEEGTTQNFNVSKKYKQILALIFILLLFIGSINYLTQFNSKLEEKKSITKFIGSFICIIIAGITLLDIEQII